MITASETTSGLYHAPKKTFPIFQETHLHSIKSRSQENHFLTPVNAGGKACIPQKFNIRQLLKKMAMFEAGVTIFQKTHHFGISKTVSFRGMLVVFSSYFLDAEAHGTSSGYPKVDASQLPEAATVTSHPREPAASHRPWWFR